MILKDLRIAILITSMALIFGCGTLSSNRNWPSEIPDQQIFVDCYQEKQNLTHLDPKLLDAHLTWIKRFYQGTILYPNGWINASSQFLDSVPDAPTRKDLRERMHTLGISISCEWAQDNDVRKIDSINMSVWASAMRESAFLNDQANFVNQVENDVAKLLSDEIDTSEITLDRYYPDDDYDNF